MNRDQLSRRTFLQASAAATATALSAKSYAQILGAKERIVVGVIGAGDDCGVASSRGR